MEKGTQIIVILKYFLLEGFVSLFSCLRSRISFPKIMRILRQSEIIFSYFHHKSWQHSYTINIQRSLFDPFLFTIYSVSIPVDSKHGSAKVLTFSLSEKGGRYNGQTAEISDSSRLSNDPTFPTSSLICPFHRGYCRKKTNKTLFSPQPETEKDFIYAAVFHQ